MSIRIRMPALTARMRDGALVKWWAAEGDMLSAGDLLCEVETDRASMEIEAPSDGVLTRILAPAGATGIAVDAVLAEMRPANEDAAPAKATASAEPARIPASPLARRLAAERGVPLSAISGTGPGGRVVAADLNALPVEDAPRAAPARPPRTTAAATAAAASSAILRRSFRCDALRSAVAQVEAEFGAAPHLLDAMLARAAARALTERELPPSVLLFAETADGAERHLRIADPCALPLSALAAQIPAAPAPDAPEAAIRIANLSELGVALVDLSPTAEQPLALGLGAAEGAEDPRGPRRAARMTLSLAIAPGHLPLRDAARLLARIAELLERPTALFWT